MTPPAPTHRDALAPAALTLAGRLAGRPWADDFYLAGSAALALYTGHRPVRDLDLMAATNRLTSPERRDLLADLLALEPATEVETARDGYLSVRLPGTALRLFYYPYPLADPHEELDGLAVVSAVDLGLMKLGAIISRGTRRDFTDLYLLCRALPLDEILARAGDKFGHVRDFPLQALKGLADLSQTAGEPMPSLLQPLAWEEVAAWAQGEVRRLGRAHTGLADPPEDP
jgi:hypothetical protein